MQWLKEKRHDPRKNIPKNKDLTSPTPQKKTEMNGNVHIG
jgi:hypothetical protein